MEEEMEIIEFDYHSPIKHQEGYGGYIQVGEKVYAISRWNWERISEDRLLEEINGIVDNANDTGGTSDTGDGVSEVQVDC